MKPSRTELGRLDGLGRGWMQTESVSDASSRVAQAKPTDHAGQPTRHGDTHLRCSHRRLVGRTGRFSFFVCRTGRRFGATAICLHNCCILDNR